MLVFLNYSCLNIIIYSWNILTDPGLVYGKIKSMFNRSAAYYSISAVYDLSKHYMYTVSTFQKCLLKNIKVEWHVASESTPV